MNITLRKASALQNSINDALKLIQVKLTIDINEFEDVVDAVSAANAVMIEQDLRRQKLTMALYNIRALVGTANVTSGINTALAKAAFIDKRIGQMEELSKAVAMTDMAVLTGKLEKIRNDKGTDGRRSAIYGYADTVTTSVLSVAQIEQSKAEVLNLKKQKQQINDEVLESNIKTQVPLTAETVTVLQAENLL